MLNSLVALQRGTNYWMLTATSLRLPRSEMGSTADRQLRGGLGSGGFAEVMERTEHLHRLV